MHSKELSVKGSSMIPPENVVRGGGRYMWIPVTAILLF